MCRPTKKQVEREAVVDRYYSEEQEHVVHAMMMQQQMELEQLIQIAENLKNDIMKLHDQEQALIERLKVMEQSRSSLFTNLYSFISNKKNVLLFVSGFLTGFYVIPTISKIFSSTRV